MPHTPPPSTTTSKNRHRLSLVLSPPLPVHLARAVNSTEDLVEEALNDQQQQQPTFDIFNDGDMNELNGMPSLPHLWTDPSPVRPSADSSRNMKDNDQVNATLPDSRNTMDSTSISELADYTALFTAATSTPNTVSMDQRPSSSSSMSNAMLLQRSPSSLSSDSEHADGQYNRFSIASTAATSEGCHRYSRQHAPHTASKHNSLSGVLEGATTKQDGEDEVDGEADVTLQGVGEIATVTGEISISSHNIHPSASIDDTAALNEPPTSQSAMQPNSATQDDTAQRTPSTLASSAPPPEYAHDDGTHRRGPSISSSISVRSTCTSTVTTNNTTTPNNSRRSFLSNILSRSGSSSSRHAGRDRSIPPRTRTVSSQIGNDRPIGGLSTSNQSSTSGSVHHNHTRHSSNPASSSSSSFSRSSPSLYAMITPASPLPTEERIMGADNSATTYTPMESRSQIETMRRSFTGTSQNGPLAPLPNDSVFSNATRAYIEEDDNDHHRHHNALNRPSSALGIERASSPSSLFVRGNRASSSSSSSRASRLLARPFTSPSTPNTTGSQSEGRFGDVQDTVRRSPTPTRFFGSGNGGTRPSSSMPILPSAFNDSTSFVTSGLSQNNMQNQSCSIISEQEKPNISPPQTTLSTFGLELKQLSPQLSISRLGQPLCGTILDKKYLLIGTNFGLDFLPLHREGNKTLKNGLFSGVSLSLAERFGSSYYGSSNEASSSISISASASTYQNRAASNSISIEQEQAAPTTTSSSARKVRKPIPLIKKTRFKQLIILSERSNVLLAIAGRNDHVRVYSLDNLRKLIEKKMKEIDASSSASTATTTSCNSSSKPINWNNGTSKKVKRKGAIGLGISSDKKPPVPALPADAKGKGRVTSENVDATASESLHGPRHTRSYTMQRQYSPPPDYTQSHASTSTQTTGSVSDPSTSSSLSTRPTPEHTAQKPQTSNWSDDPPRSPASSQFASPSPTSTHRSSPRHSPREQVVTSPRSSMRRAKSRETLRRPSAGSSFSTATITASTSVNARSMSRRGSSATVTLDNMHTHPTNSNAGRRRPSVATIVPTSPSAAIFTSTSLVSTITRRGSTAQLADMGQVTSEEHAPRILSNDDAENNDNNDGEDEDSYEWVDAPEFEEVEQSWRGTRNDSGYSFPPHPAMLMRQNDNIPAVPPIPEQYASSSSATFAQAPMEWARGRSASNMSSWSQRSRMTPRSARVVKDQESDKDGEGQDSVYASPQLGDSATLGEEAGRHRRPKNSRLSLAEILQETEISNTTPAVSNNPHQENARSDPIPSTSRFPDSRLSKSTPSTPSSRRYASGTPNRLTARSARAEASHSGLADLADFLNEVPPSSMSNSSERDTARAIAPRVRRSLSSTGVIDMQQLNGPQSPVASSMLATRSPSLLSLAPVSATPKLSAREATTSKRDQAEIEARDVFMSFLREGPPEVPTTSGASASNREGAGTSSRQGHTRKLQKGQSRSTMSLQSNTSSRSAPAPALRSASAATYSTARQYGIPSAETQAESSARIRTRSDGATLNRAGNFILPADEIVPVPVSVTTPAANDSFVDKTRKRRSMQPRSPTNRHFIAEVETSNMDGDDRPGQMTRGLSFQEMLSIGGFEGQSDDASSPALGSEDDIQAARSRLSSREADAASQRESPAPRNRRNRWSLLTGIRSASIDSDVLSSTQAMASAVQQASLTNSGGEGTANAAVEGRLVETVTTLTTGDQTASFKPLRLPHLVEDESPPFGNLTPDMEQQAARGAVDPDGTTIMFTQRTSRTVANGGTSSGIPDGNGTSSFAESKSTAGVQNDSATGNLTYVKLARTKGSRFIRASETGKRTYLAVLCGEQGERIELFTGAKNVALSLNRTFVLPETPRTIEFQLQGEDLLDLYLIYDSAIFALEPSTVRVREVGIQRHERRQARRERERLLRQAGALEGIDTSIPSTPNSRLPRVREETDSSTADQITPQRDEAVLSTNTSSAVNDPATVTATAPPVSSDDSSRIVSEAENGESAVTDLSAPEGARGEGEVTGGIDAGATSTSGDNLPSETTAGTVAAGVSEEEMDTPLTNASALPYTTFQQLEYLPHIPPSVLASSYIIPPTYETVLSASPNPEDHNGMFMNSQLTSASSSMSNISSLARSSGSPHTPVHASLGMSRSTTLSSSSQSIVTAPLTLLTPDWSSPFSPENQKKQAQASPLLSPVSLLANPSARNNGPPGLFFVSKGRNTTGIVDGDGRSVVRKPVSWLDSEEELLDMPEQYEGLNHFSRIEILLTSEDKTRVCLAAFGPTGVRAVELGHPTLEHSIEVIPYEAQKRQQKSLTLINTLRAAGKEISDEMVYVRDVTYLAKEGQCAFFAERVGSNVAIYSLGAIGYTFY